MVKSILKILSNNWEDYTKDIKPINSKIEIFFNDGMINPIKVNVYTLLNILVKEFCKNGVYLEIGIHKGCILF